MNGAPGAGGTAPFNEILVAMINFPTCLRWAIVLTIAGLSSGTVSADDDAQVRERLERTKTASCTFSAMTIGDWQSGEQRAITKPSTLSVSFEAINADDGTARVSGQIGTVDVVVKLSNGALHFVESFREGPLYITTIFPVAAGNGRATAVHSRHEFTKVQVAGYTWRPEQYYGTCAIDR